MNTLLVTTALRLEAQPFIDHLHMKKSPHLPGFDLYSGTGLNDGDTGDQEYLVLITGTGKLRSATAVSAVLTRLLETRNPENLYMANAGCAGVMAAGSSSGSGDCASGLYLITRITDQASGLDMYPEIYGLDREMTARCVTLDRPFMEPASETDYLCQERGTVLCDMEASGAFTAASAFLPYENLLFMKYPSDRGTRKADPELIQTLASETMPAVLETADRLLNRKSEYLKGRSRKADPSPSDGLSYLTSALHCSETMGQQLKRLCRYLELTDRTEELDSLTARLKKEGTLPAPDRRRGKALLEYIYNSLLV